MADAMTPEEAEDTLRGLSGEPLYDRILPYGIDLSVTAVSMALAEVKYETPVLHVSPTDFANALEIARALGGIVAVKADPRLQTDEWFVAYGGKRAGSEGA